MKAAEKGKVRIQMVNLMKSEAEGGYNVHVQFSNILRCRQAKPKCLTKKLVRIT